MSTPAEVLTALHTQLTDDTTLSEYVKNIYLGIRENITAFPFIIIEPIKTTETEERYGIQTLKMRVAVIGYIQSINKDTPIIGDTNNKGILDIENDIKKAIDSSRTLSGNCIHTSLAGESTYDISNYPVRAVQINIDILFEQQSNVRT
jgi:hypothetical protein